MASTSEIRQWLKAEGVTVGDKGALPAALVARYNAAHGITSGPRRLPTPEEAADLPPEDFGDTIDVDDSPSRDEIPAAGPPPPHTGGGPVPEPPGEDEPPPHARRSWREPPRSKGPKGKPLRITQAVRGDINGKISFALEIPARIWQARDPVCGTVFVEQRPEIADALTEIVCQSPDLVAWFAGGGGQFMLALNLMATLWPVVTVVMAHHVYHSVELGPPDQAQAPPYRQYAA